MKSNILKEKKFCQEMTMKCLMNYKRTGVKMYEERARDFYMTVMLWDKKIKSSPKNIA